VDLARRLWLAVEIVALLVGLGSLLYLLVSFAAMSRHAPSRPARRAFRALFHEALAVAVTQPLIPLYYVIGRRMGGPSNGRPVVLVHGYFQNRADFLYLAAALRRAGVGPIYGFNYDWSRTIAACAARLGAFVEAVCRETGATKVALVAHSLGGIVALEYLEAPEGAARVERCVTIASPHAGVLWRIGALGRSSRQLRVGSEYMRGLPARARLPVPVVSLYSSHDNIVHPASTSALAVRGGRDQEIPDLGHLGMLFSSEVASAVVAALQAQTGG
jgi:pimeloyl-ACP methyl ester carboxylesterase